MNKRIIKSFIATLTLLMVVGCPTNPTTKGFTADMVQKVNNQKIEGKIFVKENEYRMDIKERGEDISILVNRESGKQKIILHARKRAEEVLNTGNKSLSNNPFESFYYSLEKNSSREKGTEVINGYTCKKIEVYDKDKSLLTAWVSDSLNWPIKIRTEFGHPKEVELSNIKEETVEENLFQVPKGYRFSPLPKPKKEKTTSKEKPVDIREIKQAASKKLEEKGIELKNADGTIKIRRIMETTLTRYFPGWYIFFINREKKVDGKITLGYVPFEKAVVSEDKKEIHILKSPEKDVSLTNEIKMLQKRKIKLTSEKEVRDFGKALVTLYFRGAKAPIVESLGKNEWALYNGTSSGYLKGFIVKLDDNGEITELNYKLKIKEQ